MTYHLFDSFRSWDLKVCVSWATNCFRGPWCYIRSEVDWRFSLKEISDLSATKELNRWPKIVSRRWSMSTNSQSAFNPINQSENFGRGRSSPFGASSVFRWALTSTVGRKDCDLICSGFTSKLFNTWLNENVSQIGISFHQLNQRFNDQGILHFIKTVISIYIESLSSRTDDKGSQ